MIIELLCKDTLEKDGILENVFNIDIKYDTAFIEYFNKKLNKNVKTTYHIGEHIFRIKDNKRE